MHNVMYIKLLNRQPGPAVGDRPWLGGTKCGDAKCCGWSSLDQVWQRCIVWGTDCGGTIGSVTEHTRVGFLDSTRVYTYTQHLHTHVFLHDNVAS